MPGVPPPPPPLAHLERAGSVIAGKYAIVRVIGEGGMGVVYEATHLRLRQRVAVKMLQKEMLTHEVIVSRFEREARAAAQLRSRHTARVMDVDVTTGPHGGLPYMVMEFLEGRDLESELAERVRLPYDEAVDVVLQACAAMLEAHALGIVHRDLKPANLFLARDDHDARARIVKVLDFGISKSQNETDAKLTTADSVMGTALYMSPEQVRGAVSVDQRSDIWALGVILYELTSGRPPWTGSPTQLAAAIVTEDPPDILQLVELPLELAAVIGKCLRRDAAMRFQDVRELAMALAELSKPNGAGRLFADAVLAGNTGPYGQPSLSPIQDMAPIPVRALSEDRMRGPGTAPGWSQHDAPRERKPRTVLSAMLAAFAVGIVVLGGAAIAWWKLTTRSTPTVAAAISATPTPPPAIPTPEVTAPSVVASASVAPAPVPVPAPTTSSAVRGKVKGKAPPVVAPATPASPPTASSLPLLL